VLYVDGAGKGLVEGRAVRRPSGTRPADNGPVKLRLRIYDKAGNVRYLTARSSPTTPPRR
jgi:hypothetical protein